MCVPPSGKKSESIHQALPLVYANSRFSNSKCFIRFLRHIGYKLPYFRVTSLQTNQNIWLLCRPYLTIDSKFELFAHDNVHRMTKSCLIFLAIVNCIAFCLMKHLYMSIKKSSQGCYAISIGKLGIAFIVHILETNVAHFSLIFGHLDQKKLWKKCCNYWPLPSDHS